MCIAPLRYTLKRTYRKSNNATHTIDAFRRLTYDIDSI
jgi:hypothetical protein